MNVSALVARAAIVRAIRAFFDGRDFVEVETPVHIAAPAPEPHIDCPAVAAGGFLRASPELQMKKLLAEGLPRIYQIGPCFRAGERGSRHNPEFTMIEWYRRGETYEAIADDLEMLFRQLSDAFAPAKLRADSLMRVAVRDAYLQHAGWDPWQNWDADRFDFDMATRIEPALKNEEGVFLMDYPPQAASLAKLAERSYGHVAERWEFYWKGMELANCFTELCDAAEQRARFERAAAERRQLQEADYPLDEEFLGCLPRVGSAAGVALGVDRLVMVLTEQNAIMSVRATE